VLFVKNSEVVARAITATGVLKSVGLSGNNRTARFFLVWWITTFSRLLFYFMKKLYTSKWVLPHLGINVVFSSAVTSISEVDAKFVVCSQL